MGMDYDPDKTTFQIGDHVVFNADKPDELSIPSKIIAKLANQPFMTITDMVHCPTNENANNCAIYVDDVEFIFTERCFVKIKPQNDEEQPRVMRDIGWYQDPSKRMLK